MIDLYVWKFSYPVLSKEANLFLHPFDLSLEELFLLHLSDVLLLGQVSRHGPLRDIANALALRLLGLVNVLVLFHELAKVGFAFMLFGNWGDEDIVIIMLGGRR